MHSYRVAPLILVKNKNFIIMGPGWLTAGSLPLFPFFFFAGQNEEYYE